MLAKAPGQHRAQHLVLSQLWLFWPRDQPLKAKTDLQPGLLPWMLAPPAAMQK